MQYENMHRAERNYDRMEAVEIITDDWTPIVRKEITDSQIETFIAEVASSGYAEDNLGAFKPVGGIYHAIARQWVKDKSAVGEIVGPAFWEWAKACAYLSAYRY